MSETKTTRVPTGDGLSNVTQRNHSPDALQESLDELERVADSLVDDLTVELVEEPALAEEDTPDSRRAEMQRTLDDLNRLIEDPHPPPVSREVEIEGDRGEDISERLDVLLESAPSDEVVEPPTPIDHSPFEDHMVEMLEPSASTEELTVERHAAEPAVAPAETGAPAVTQVEAPVADEPEIETRAVTEPPARIRRRSRSVWPVLMIVALLGAVAGTVWYLRAPETSSSLSAEADVPMPDPPVVFTKTPKREPAGVTRDDAPQRPATSRPKPVAEPRLPQDPGATTAYASASRQTASVKPEPTTPEPVVEPRTTPEPDATDSLARSEPRPEPVAPEPAAVAPIVEPPAEPATDPASSVETPIRIASIGGVLLPTIEEPTAPEPEESFFEAMTGDPPDLEPVEPTRPDRAVAVPNPTNRPPVAVERGEPVFDESAFRRGEKQTVVLRVLVTESGRVVRVVVDESVQGSEAEAAAINAVLRWTYEPALENGEPVRRWTTERFEFERP